MSSRDDILARVRKNQPAPQPLPAVPTFDAGCRIAARALQGRARPHGRQGRRRRPPTAISTR